MDTLGGREPFKGACDLFLYTVNVHVLLLCCALVLCTEVCFIQSVLY